MPISSWGLGEETFISNGVGDDSDADDYADDADVEEDDDDDDAHLVKLSWAESAEMFSEEDNLSLEQVLTNLIFQQGLSSSLTI